MSENTPWAICYVDVTHTDVLIFYMNLIQKYIVSNFIMSAATLSVNLKLAAL